MVFQIQWNQIDFEAVSSLLMRVKALTADLNIPCGPCCQCFCNWLHQRLSALDLNPHLLQVLLWKHSVQKQHMCEHHLLSFAAQLSSILPGESIIQAIFLLIAVGFFMNTFKLKSKVINSVQLVLSREIFKMTYCHFSVLFQGQHIFLTKQYSLKAVDCTA